LPTRSPPELPRSAPVLRVGFAGTPAFAATALAAILDAGFEVALVMTRPDQRQGLKLVPSAVKSLALGQGLTLFQPETLRDAGAADVLARLELDVLVVAAYGLILPQHVLDLPRHGCINIHASLLPRWRGAAPIQRALLAGDAASGVSIMQMDAGLDTGALISTQVTEIQARDTAATLAARLATLGAEAVVKALDALRRDGSLGGVPQAPEGASYAHKISRDDAAIDWQASAVFIDRQVRAFDPAPGAVAMLDGKPVKIWAAEPVDGRADAPGTVLRADAGGLVIACGEGAICIRELQRAGGRRLDAAAFLAGNPIATLPRAGTPR
jgi:methionyl-tRNA formyltransferase